MKRTLSLVLAGVLAASTMVMSSAPAAAQGVGLTIGLGNWDNDRWHDEDWRYRHHRHRSHVAPGVYFNLGVPGPRAYYRPYYRDRDCWRDWDGAVVCRY